MGANDDDDDIGQLTSADDRWLEYLQSRYRLSNWPLQRKKADLLGELRRQIDADYVCWGAGMQNVKTADAAVLEFKDDAVGSTDDDVEGAGPAARERYLTWSRFFYRSNINRHIAPMYFGLVANTPHVTVTGTMIRSAAGIGDRRSPWREKLKAVMTIVMLHPLTAERRSIGLGDFMLTMCQPPQHPTKTLADPALYRFVTGIGCHRVLAKPAFGPRERRVADEVSLTFPWIHATTGDTEFDATRLRPQYRLLLPLLLTYATYEEIATRLDVNHRTLPRQVGAIADQMGLPVGTRDAIREYCRFGRMPDLSTVHSRDDSRHGLKNLEE